MADDTILPNTDLEQLLADYSNALAFPRTPDIASAVEARLGARQDNRGRGMAVSTEAVDVPNTAEVHSPQPVPLPTADVSPQPSRFRQILGFAAGAVAFAIIAILLAAVFRGFADPSPDSERGLVSSDTATPPANLLVAVSIVYDEPQETWETKTSRVSVYDAQSGEELFSVDAGSSVNASIAPDGARLYIHSWSPTGDRDELVAIDAASGKELWSKTGRNAVDSSGGLLPSAVAVSQDGSQIFVMEPDYNRPPDHRRVIPYHVEIFDAHDGDRVAEFDAPNCPARLFPSLDERTLYILCLNSGVSFSIAIDLETGERIIENLFRSASEGVRSAIQSPDRRLLYGLTGEAITVVNLNERRIIDEIALQLDVPMPEPYTPQSLALSADGSRLYVGLAKPSEITVDSISEVAVVDTSTWREIDRVTVEPPVAAGTLSNTPDRDSIFAAHNERMDAATTVEQGVIVRVHPGQESSVLATRPNEEILRIFSHSVIQPVEDKVTDEPPPETVLGPLRVSTTEDGRRLNISPVDPTTLEPLPGYEPISLGHHYTHAFSPNGQTMAVITWPVEGGGAGWGGKLYLIDLADWTMTDTGVEIEQNTRTLLYAADGKVLYWTLATSIHPAHGMQRDYELYRFDLEGGSQETIAEFPSSFSPSDLRSFHAGTRLAIWGPSVDPNNIVDGPPRMIIVDLQQDQIVTDIEIPNVRAGQYQETDGGTVSYRIFRPGLAWDLDRSLLYIAHADEERITVIDLDEGAIKLQADIAQPQSAIDRFIDWIAPSASAKSNQTTSRFAFLSSDGARLYVAGSHESFIESDDGGIVRTDETDLVIVDTVDITEIGRMNLGTVVNMQPTLDNRYLVVRSYERVASTTGHRLTKLDLATGEVLQQLDLPNHPASGPAITSEYGVLQLSIRVGDAFQFEELRIDMESMTILSREGVDSRGYNVILEAQ